MLNIETMLSNWQFKRGKSDCKNGYRDKYQKLCLERRMKGLAIRKSKMAYIDGFNVAMNRS